MTGNSSSGSSGSGGQGPGGPRRISDELLGGLKPRRGDKTGEWVKSLADDAVAAADALNRAQQQQQQVQPAVVQQPVTRRKMTNWIDRLFECFGEYEYEYNHAVDQPDLQIHVAPPEFVQSAERDSSSGEPIQIIRGRLYTTEWTLSIRALPSKIEGYIVPNSMAIRLTVSPGEFFQFLDVDAAAQEGTVVWSLDGQSIAWDEVPGLAKQLFAKLVRVSRGEGEPTERFSFARERPAAPAAGNQPAPEPGFLKPQAVPTAPAADLMGQGAFVQGSGPSLADAWGLMIRAIDRELATLGTTGSQAFARSDMLAAQKALRRTERLQSVRADMIATLDRWRAALKED